MTTDKGTKENYTEEVERRKDVAAIEEEENEEMRDITFNAVKKAEDAFDDFLEDQGYDPVYWRLKIEASELSSDMNTPVRKITVEPHPSV